MKQLKENRGLELFLHINILDDGTLHASVGTYEWKATDDFPTFETLEHLRIE